MLRKKKLFYNTVSALVFQVTTIICGFILPSLIIRTYGSSVNGLVNSITQFLGIISFFELGMGAVVQSSLYKPLAENKMDEVSKIVTSAERFFKRLAWIFVLYIMILILLYPMLSNEKIEWFYSAILILSMSISSFAQYYFGIVDRLLLIADQNGYIQYTIQIITLIGNTVISVILICFGVEIYLVKLTTSVIYLIRPIIIRWYVNRKYRIIRNATYDIEPIKQKWNGVAQHLAAVILDGTDSVVLTIFASLSDVSVYSVYFLVISGVKQLFMSLVSGVQSLIGELWAKKELEKLNRLFGLFEWFVHMGVLFVFGCTGSLIVSFVQLYTKGISDVNYIRPVFATILTIANAGHCLRLPYNVMILAGGKYKETQSNYIIAMSLNVVVSIVFVCKFGLVGVAVGTLIAMIYQTVWMAIYISKNLIKWSITNFIKQIILDAIIVVLASLFSLVVSFKTNSYFVWCIKGLCIAGIWLSVIGVVNFILNKEKLIYILKKFKTKFL